MRTRISTFYGKECLDESETRSCISTAIRTKAPGKKYRFQKTRKPKTRTRIQCAISYGLINFLSKYALHSTLHTLHLPPCTLHSTSHTLHSTPCITHSTLNTLHPASYTLHSTPYIPHPTLYYLHHTHYTLQNTAYIQK